jgi:hypothetical protein
MSIIHVVAQMECDRCKVVVHIVASALPLVRKKARAQGWSNDGRKDFCVNCNGPVPKKAKP